MAAIPSNTDAEREEQAALSSLRNKGRPHSQQVSSVSSLSVFSLPLLEISTVCLIGHPSLGRLFIIRSLLSHLLYYSLLLATYSDSVLPVHFLILVFIFLLLSCCYIASLRCCIHDVLKVSKFILSLPSLFHIPVPTTLPSSF